MTRTRRPGVAPRFLNRRVGAPFSLTARSSRPSPVEVRVGRAALLAVHQESRALAGHGREPTGAVAEQQQAAAGIVARRGDVGREEVLAEEQILFPSPLKSAIPRRRRVPIALPPAMHGPSNRSPRFQEHDVIERIRAQPHGALGRGAEYLSERSRRHTRGMSGAVVPRWEAAATRRSNDTSVPARPMRGSSLCQQHVRPAASAEETGVEEQGVGGARVVIEMRPHSSQ